MRPHAPRAAAVFAAAFATVVATVLAAGAAAAGPNVIRVAPSPSRAPARSAPATGSRDFSQPYASPSPTPTWSMQTSCSGGSRGWNRSRSFPAVGRSTLGCGRFWRGRAAPSAEAPTPGSVDSFSPSAPAPRAPPIIVGGRDADLSLTGAELVRLLGDPMFSDEGKWETEKELLRGGMTSVPALIGGLSNRKPYDVRELTDAEGRRETVTVTVAEQCETLLYHVVTPPRLEPPEGAGPPRDAVMFTVRNWPAWWEKNRGRSLQQVHADIRAVVARYWEQGGVEQVVE